MRRGAATLALLVMCALGAPAGASSLEQLVMPGPLTAGHAKLESDCGSCHASFKHGAQDQLCLDCHKPVAADVAAKAGFHGRLLAKAPEACQDCHADHKGRDTSIVALNVELFDHAMTDFALRGGHIGVACGNCHEAGKKFREAPGQCVACHRADEPHKGRLGDDCGSCHNETSWKEIRFDHSKTHFPLTGAHRDATCAACHFNEVYQKLETKCVSCHALDDTHKGTRGDNCGNCHDTTRWKVERFDHFAKTGFALVGKHTDLQCPACHLEGMTRPKPPDTCIGCHSVDDKHAGRNGTDCAHCHGVDAWDKTTFDHLRESDFALEGMHAKIECVACHVGNVKDPLPKTCDECHKADDPHRGTLSPCSRCHNPASWHDVTFNHDFTHFPLIGQHRVVACETCHSGVEYAGTKSECRACHAADDHHRGALGDDCGRCHNPNSWSRWEFDHNLETHFALDGRHRGLDCDACHRPGGPPPVELSQACVSCHRQDDAHRGRFGPDCGRCHTTEAFSDLKKFEP